MFEDLDLAELGLELPADKAEALKAALAAKGQEAVDKAVTGLKAKNSELLGTIKTTKGELDQLKGQFEGLDINAVKQLLAKTGQDEEAKLIAEGKIDEVLNKRTERLRAEHERQLKVEKDRAAAALAEAADDFVFRSRGMFAFDESGEVVAVDGDGHPIIGKDGKTPVSPLEWAESLKEAAPHLWPRAAGAGAPGNNGGKAAKKWGDLSEVERARLARENPEAFKRLMATKEG
jgi:hypothetical protein